MVSQATIDLVESYFNFKLDEHASGLETTGSVVGVSLDHAIVGIDIGKPCSFLYFIALIFIQKQSMTCQPS